MCFNYFAFHSDLLFFPTRRSSDLTTVELLTTVSRLPVSSVTFVSVESVTPMVVSVPAPLRVPPISVPHIGSADVRIPATHLSRMPCSPPKNNCREHPLHTPTVHQR